MRNFKVDLFSRNYFRKLLGFIGIFLVNWLFIGVPETSIGFLGTLFLNAGLLYLVLEFSSFAGDAYITLDFRTEKEKEEDSKKRKYDAIDGAIESIIMETAIGNLSKAKANERLEALSEIKFHLDTMYQPALPPPAEHKEDNSFLEMPKKNDFVEEGLKLEEDTENVMEILYTPLTESKSKKNKS